MTDTNQHVNYVRNLVDFKNNSVHPVIYLSDIEAGAKLIYKNIMPPN